MIKAIKIVLVFLVFTCEMVNINAQVVISTPTLGFTQACASPDFNTYNVSFSFSPENALASSNQFILELSDASGSFDNAIEVYSSSPGSIVSSPASISFALPQDVGGENYKVRVKSTSPAATSSNSQEFAAYYKSQDSPFSINNLIDTGVFCPNGSYLLTIDNPGGPLNDSPLNYPNLTFNWYKETSNTSAVFVASGESLLVEEEGTYFVETNYGSCTSDSFSNRVTISEASNSNEFEISSSLGNPFCASDGMTTLSAINGEQYQWFKDGVLIPNATNQTFETDGSGTYSVNVNLGECSADATIELEASGFNATIDTEEFVVLEEDENIWVTVTTDALNPEFKWTLNGEPILDEVSDFIEISQTGVYSVEITQTQNCIATKQFQFTVMEAFPDVDAIPNLISPNSDGVNDTWIIPLQYTTGTNTLVQILDPVGKLVFETNDYQNNWPLEPIEFKEVNPVYYYIITPTGQSSKKGTITVIK